MINAAIGHPQQTGGVWRYRLDDGPGLGQRVWLLHGHGWQVQLLPDRGLDALSATWHGTNIAWLNSGGLTDPAAFDPRGLGWLRSFTGGLLTTGGPTWFGPPCQDGGAELGLHGRFHVTPVEQINSWTSQDADGSVYHVGGLLRDVVLFGDHLRIEREWRLSERGLRCRDTVHNDGEREAPLCLLYHCNFGWPLLDESTRFEGQFTHSMPRDQTAAACTDWRCFSPPTNGFAEEVWFHQPVIADDQRANVVLANPAEGLRCTLNWNAVSMPWLTQWRNLAPRAYVCGLEPGTSCVHSRAELRQAGELPMLAAGTSRQFDIRFGCSRL
jgi:galactose mutarotase-like enzyme